MRYDILYGTAIQGYFGMGLYYREMEKEMFVETSAPVHLFTLRNVRELVIFI
jgi:hypothetical protein